MSTHQASNRRHPSARRSRVSRSALRAAMLGRVSEAFGGAGGPGRLGTLALERRLSRMTCSCAKYGTHRPTYTHLRPGRFRESPERARPWCRCHGRRTPSSKTPETGRFGFRFSSGQHFRESVAPSAVVTKNWAARSRRPRVPVWCVATRPRGPRRCPQRVGEANRPRSRARSREQSTRICVEAEWRDPPASPCSRTHRPAGTCHGLLAGPWR